LKRTDIKDDLEKEGREGLQHGGVSEEKKGLEGRINGVSKTGDVCLTGKDLDSLEMLSMERHRARLLKIGEKEGFCGDKSY